MYISSLALMGKGVVYQSFLIETCLEGKYQVLRLLPTHGIEAYLP